MNRLYELIGGKRGIAADTALRLKKLLKASQKFWMNLLKSHFLRAPHAKIVGIDLVTTRAGLSTRAHSSAAHG
jgi:plasmid maintenance system antidote protein VapI